MKRQGLNQKGHAWVRGLRNGDHGICQEFALGVKPMVLACCHMLGVTPDAADDVMGDTYLSVLKGIKAFSDRSRFSSWVWTIAYRQTVNYLRRQGRDRRLTNHRPEEVSSAPGPEEAVVAQERFASLRRAVDQLPPHWARAIDLYYWQSQSTREIAQTMQVGDGVVRAYLFRGRNRLRNLLQAC